MKACMLKAFWDWICYCEDASFKLLYNYYQMESKNVYFWHFCAVKEVQMLSSNSVLFSSDQGRCWNSRGICQFTDQRGQWCCLPRHRRCCGICEVAWWWTWLSCKFFSWLETLSESTIFFPLGFSHRRWEKHVSKNISNALMTKKLILHPICSMFMM
jgi:hypothetical protein